MPNQKNIETVEQIKQDLDSSSAMWVVDYRGLTVKEIQELRRNIREADAQMIVYKNTLMSLALKDKELPELESLLEGPSAFVFAGDDAAASAKAVKNFAKGNDNLTIKGGIMDGVEYDASQVEAIASLPSKDELMAKLAGAISGVARGLATSINGVPSGVCQGIKAVADQKPADEAA